MPFLVIVARDVRVAPVPFAFFGESFSYHDPPTYSDHVLKAIKGRIFVLINVVQDVASTEDIHRYWWLVEA